MSNVHRIRTLDYLKGFVFVLLALDHSAHSYGLYWGKYHFYTSAERSVLGDIFYLHNNNVIMPLLFFLVGYATVTAVEVKGHLNHLISRIWRYCVPFVLFIPTILPLMIYPRFISNNPTVTYTTYWFDHFFTKYLQGGPMWVMYALFLFTLITVTMHKFLPFIWKMLTKLVHLLTKHWAVVIIFLGVLFSLSFTISELIWGPYYWISFKKLFGLQGSKFVVQFLCFLIGAVCASIKLFANEDLIEQLSTNWLWFGLGYVVLGINYISYAIINSWDGGAYSYDVLRHIIGGGDYGQIPYIIGQIYPKITIRCFLQGFFLCFQMLFFISLFFRFCSGQNKTWGLIAANGFGIFLFHEVITIWLQYVLDDVNFMPIIVKIITVFGVSLLSGLVISMLVRKAVFVRKVIG